MTVEEIFAKFANQSKNIFFVNNLIKNKNSEVLMFDKRTVAEKTASDLVKYNRKNLSKNSWQVELYRFELFDYTHFDIDDKYISQICNEYDLSDDIDNVTDEEVFEILTILSHEHNILVYKKWG